jgi:hypothetical protein
MFWEIKEPFTNLRRSKPVQYLLGSPQTPSHKNTTSSPTTPGSEGRCQVPWPRRTFWGPDSTLSPALFFQTKKCFITKSSRWPWKSPIRPHLVTAPVRVEMMFLQGLVINFSNQLGWVASSCQCLWQAVVKPEKPPEWGPCGFSRSCNEKPSQIREQKQSGAGLWANTFTEAFHRWRLLTPR